MSYRYGTYGTFGKSIGASAVQSDTTAVYFGTAPVNLVKGWKGKNIVNYPVKINTLLQAQEKIGYASATEAARLLGLCQSNIWAAVNGRRELAYGRRLRRTPMGV